MKKYHLYNLFLLLFLSTTLTAQTKRMDNAHTSQEYTVENREHTNLPILRQADRQIRAYQYMEALLTLDNAVAQNPNSAEALLLRARVKKLMGMATESKDDFKLAYRINPYVGNLYGYPVNSSVVTLMEMEPQQAVQNLTTDQKLNYYYYALDNMVLEKGNTAEEMKQIDRVLQHMEVDEESEAKDLLDTILLNFPASAIAHDLMGTIYFGQNNVLLALDEFSKAVLIEPEFAIAWYNLAQVERSFGHIEKAKTYLDKAISLQENLTKAYFERATISKKMGNHEEALADYEQIIKQNGSGYMEAYANRGLTKKTLGDYNGAMVDIDKAIDDFPNQPALYKNRGNLQLIFGLQRKAIDDYSRAIELDAEYAEAYFNRAIANFQLYNRVSACADLGTSKSLGYEKAAEMERYFCGE
ncbi:MAG: tetratricopeptide (TPR) repeat protein [Gammaproteobacteria bacterium]|jgi:tetratricopeptide (TPR) repeat protein